MSDSVSFTISFNAADLAGSAALADLMVHLDVEVTGPAEVSVHQVTFSDNAPAWVDLSVLADAARAEIADHPEEALVRSVDIAGVLTTLQQYQTLYRLWPEARTIHGEPVEIDDLRAAGLA